MGPHGRGQYSRRACCLSVSWPASSTAGHEMTSTYIKLCLAMLFWGGTFVAGRLVSQEVGPYTAAFIRFLTASLFLMPLLAYRESGFPKLDSRQMLAVLLLGLTGVFAYNLLFFSGLRTVEAGRAALIVAANPAFIALFSALFFEERFGLMKSAGFVISILGGVVVISRGHPAALLEGEIGAGEWMLVGCVFSWVAYTLIGKRVLHGLSPLAAVTYSCMVGAMLLSMPAYDEGLFQSLADLSLLSAFNLFYLAFFGTVLGFVWFYGGIKGIGPARAGLFINLVPVSGVSFGIILLGETPSVSLATGAVLVITGLYIANRYA